MNPDFHLDRARRRLPRLESLARRVLHWFNQNLTKDLAELGEGHEADVFKEALARFIIKDALEGFEAEHEADARARARGCEVPAAPPPMQETQVLMAFFLEMARDEHLEPLAEFYEMVLKRLRA